MRLKELLGGYRVSGDGYQAARPFKAAKLIHILEQSCTLTGADILDIGCGSGLLLASLKKLRPDIGHLVGVDMHPLQPAEFHYIKVTNTSLPFDDCSFDILISNHVIEHVGTSWDQDKHISEAYRVLRPGGILYMACPNKWSLIEPHFNLAFLSWLPGNIASCWVRIRHRGSCYNCRPLSIREYLRKLRRAGFIVHNYTQLAFRYLVCNELSGLSRQILMHIPDKMISGMMMLIPTFVFVATKNSPQHR